MGAPMSTEPEVGPHRSPVARWLRRLPAGAFAALVLAIVVLVVAVLVVVNPGHRVGPVEPARPPVGGRVLPDSRLG